MIFEKFYPSKKGVFSEKGVFSDATLALASLCISFIQLRCFFTFSMKIEQFSSNSPALASTLYYLHNGVQLKLSKGFDVQLFGSINNGL